MTARRIALLILVALPSYAALAQVPSTVMRESQVSESQLIEALRPAEAMRTDGSVPGERTRSIQPRPAVPASRPPAQVARPASAAVLITFETNSAELTATAKQSLDVVARALQDQQLSGLAFAIEGHADLRGSPDDNLRLSQARADSVRQYLVVARNVDPARLRAVGKGDREPLNTREIAAPENRRVTFVTQQQ